MCCDAEGDLSAFWREETTDDGKGNQGASGTDVIPAAGGVRFVEDDGGCGTAE